MTKDELVHNLKMLAHGRVNYAEPIADFLMPDQPKVEEITESTTEQLIERFDGPTVVDVELPEPEPAVAESVAPKPKRKKS